jgi:hypothetical protein
MRGMKNVIVIFLLSLMASVGFSQTNQEPAGSDQHVSWAKERDNNYARSKSFIRQIGITQIATGSVMLPSGLVMIGFGTHKVNHPEINVNPEGDEIENQANRRGGMIMIATGALTSVAGAILIMRGTDTLKKMRNKQGEVFSELVLPSRDLGIGLRF